MTPLATFLGVTALVNAFYSIYWGLKLTQDMRLFGIIKVPWYYNALAISSIVLSALFALVAGMLLISPP